MVDALRQVASVSHNPNALGHRTLARTAFAPPLGRQVTVIVTALNQHNSAMEICCIMFPWPNCFIALHSYDARPASVHRCERCVDDVSASVAGYNQDVYEPYVALVCAVWPQ